MDKIKKMNIEKKLTDYAISWLDENFDIPLKVDIKIDGRLKTSAGSFHYTIFKNGFKPELIKIAKFTFLNGTDAVIDTLEHELIHYALCYLGKPFDDKDSIFIKTCEKLGVGLSHNYKLNKSYYICDCGDIHDFNKKVGHRYRCGKCKSKLKYLGQVVASSRKTQAEKRQVAVAEGLL